MRKKYMVTGACLLGLLGVAILLKPQSRAQSRSPARIPVSQAQIPEHVLYRHLFHHVLALKKKAEEFEKNGKDATQVRTHFKRQAELSDGQVRLLDEAAAQYDEREKVLDARAKVIIDAYKAQYPGGQVPYGQKPVPPPAELRNLSQERDALALRSRDQLRASLGSEFERFDKFIKTRVAADVKVQPAR
jgi:hypothetical protein